MSNNDDTIPPVTTHTLDPPKPDGNNDWYVSDVNVTLTATDDMSGVNVTYYSIDDGKWKIYTEPFTLSKDGDDILIEFYSVDYADNIEEVKSFTIDIDQTKPLVCIVYEITGGNWWQGWIFKFIATAGDAMSGMDYVVFYMHGVDMYTVYDGNGDEYTWTVTIPGFLPNTFNVYGLINDLEINDDYVKFNALIVKISRYFQITQNMLPLGARAYDKAGNWDCDEIINPGNSISIKPGIYLFQSIILPNNYIGHIGNHIIFATFNTN